MTEASTTLHPVWVWQQRLRRWLGNSAAPPRHDGGGDGVRVSLDELLDLRSQAAGLDLDTRQRVMTALAGGYLSGFRGRGVDFAETRHYQPGDDIRAMDWRVTARSGHPHTKLFHQERERPVLLAVDTGPSMRFGTRVAFKSVIAARAAALLAWAAAARGDRVGGMVFDRHGHRETRPAPGKRGTLRLLHLLGSDPPAATGAYSLSQALAQLRRVARPGTLVCLLSDFYDLDAEGENRLKQLAAHTDVLGCFVYDPLERALPPPDYYAVSDGQRQSLLNSADSRLRLAYQQQFEQRYARLARLFSQRGLRLLPLATDADLPTALRYGLAGRVEPGDGLSQAPPL